MVQGARFRCITSDIETEKSYAYTIAAITLSRTAIFRVTSQEKVVNIE